ncbi:LacI family transcriptional regulator [Paenibacillus sp. PastF-3]|jgi:LacI family transcriptional regulator|uniref:LacI family DNA-binding transcriptional regulator n=1 Tax=Paenibacillus sp. PastF-3 TaxID=2940626 RepID=UPI0024736B6A|nr:LacI family DNA-binding transcriptional regulator [Paenibacillus sp. PastF-3]MDH6369921.1 LacI family transcriptional regulator [Paenibacillus sp. PastF-3]
MKVKVTMQDIADRLNISKNSVSQALSGKDGVSEETRQLIIDTANEMGYTYSRGRKSTEEEAGTFVILASEFAFSKRNFFGEIYLSIEKEAAKRNKRMVIQSIDHHASEQLILPPILFDPSVEGILILSHITTPYIQAVTGTGIPTVLIDHHHPDLKADSILTNNRYAAYTAVQHLIGLGHTRIGFIGNIQFSPSYYERLEGYRLALYQSAIEYNPIWVFDHAIEEMDDVFNAVQKLDEQPTAWFCVNDGLGFLINSVMYKLGYQIPQDVSIVSFDNGQLSRITTPLTTTMDVDLSYFGRKAIEQLFWRIDHPEEPFIEILLPTHLIIRESTQHPNT